MIFVEWPPSDELLLQLVRMTERGHVNWLIWLVR